jgi:hypothetical protein
MSLGNLGDSLSNLDLGQLTQYLPNLDFPASKDEVVSEVQNNNAPQEVIDQLKSSSTEAPTPSTMPMRYWRRCEGTGRERARIFAYNLDPGSSPGLFSN